MALAGVIPFHGGVTEECWHLTRPLGLPSPGESQDSDPDRLGLVEHIASFGVVLVLAAARAELQGSNEHRRPRRVFLEWFDSPYSLANPSGTQQWMVPQQEKFGGRCWSSNGSVVGRDAALSFGFARGRLCVMFVVCVSAIFRISLIR